MAANRIWIDIETNGLDPARDAHIFEVGVVATTADADYRELASQSWVVGWDVDDAWLRARLAPRVYEMHAKSGLLYEIPFGAPIAEVEEELCRFVDFFGNPAPGREPVAGASVHFDTDWLKLHMPRVMKRFSHRIYDSSTLKQLFRDVGRGAELPGDDSPAHRVLADLRHCLAVARTVAGAVRTR